MATAKELGLKPGDLAIWASAEKHHKTWDEEGIPLDTKGVEVKIGFGKVVGVNVPRPNIGDPTTMIEVVRSTYPNDSPGTITYIHSGFSNYISEGDERLRKELEGAGIEIQIVRTEEGNVDCRVIRREKDSNP